jgi:hypothetical protein
VSEKISATTRAQQKWRGSIQTAGVKGSPQTVEELLAQARTDIASANQDIAEARESLRRYEDQHASLMKHHLKLRQRARFWWLLALISLLVIVTHFV